MKQALSISNLSGGGGDEFLLPNVSLITDTNSLFYHPLTQEEPELPYLTITALEDDFQINVHGNHYTPQYSLNGTDWFEVENRVSPTINTGEKIYFKGILEQGDSQEAYSFTTEQRFNLSGNVMSMVFGDEAEGKTDLTGYDSCFNFLFNSCTGLERVSKNFLPATTLAENCYDAMFNRCTSLETAPELPATTLAYGCYMGMFYDCTSLVAAPELPATTLADYCYQDMFAGCTSLVNVPELPATELASGCYYYMFQNCTSLVNVPELPATTLAENCYAGMFQGCTSLVNAPELPATTLAEWCYADMFYNCTSLNYIKMLATDISAESCLGNWVDNVSPTGTFVMSKNATWNPEEYRDPNGIPEGWTVETA